MTFSGKFWDFGELFVFKACFSWQINANKWCGSLDKSYSITLSIKWVFILGTMRVPCRAPVLRHILMSAQVAFFCEEQSKAAATVETSSPPWKLLERSVKTACSKTEYMVHENDP